MAADADRQLPPGTPRPLDAGTAARLPKRCVFAGRGTQFFVGEPSCMKLFPLKWIRGVWYIGLETSLFFPGATTVSTQRQLEAASIWLETFGSKDPLMPKELTHHGDGVFVIDVLAHVPPVEGSFGERGMARRGVLMRRLVSIRRLR